MSESYGSRKATENFVPSSNDHKPPGPEPSDDLSGLEVLLVVDLPDVGEALKAFLELLGASVAGPAATAGEAERVVIERLPDVALVDFHLRGGEQSYSLIARLHEQGVHVIMLSGSFEFRHRHRLRARPCWRSLSVNHSSSHT